MGGPYTLRPAGAGDADRVAAIWLAGWRDAHLAHVPAALTSCHRYVTPV